jgi:hypothetical protein
MLVPAGVLLLIAGSSVWHVWVLAAAGLAVAVAGMVALLPPGTFRLRRGVPSALAAMLLFAVGYFGADGLITVLFTDGYGQPLSHAAVALSAAPLAWALTSLLVPKLPPATTVGLVTTACGVAGLAAVLASPAWVLATVAWTVAGVGTGLAYPRLYLLSTRAGAMPAAVLAAAVITAEAFGSLVGRAAGGGVVSTAAAAHLPLRAAYAVAYAAFAACLALAAFAARRARH